jgi:hypothetical protein
VHELTEVHDTALRKLPWDALGLGMDWVVQALPFHTSANVTSWNTLLAELPTASHESAAAHETAVRKELAGPGVGCAVQVVPFSDGTACMRHDLPFHRSAAAGPGAPGLPPPHASQNVADVHDAALNSSD